MISNKIAYFPGTVHTKQDILDYLAWTYFFRRLLKNPSYYNLESLETEDVNDYLSTLVQSALNVLVNANCVEIEEVSFSLQLTTKCPIIYHCLIIFVNKIYLDFCDRICLRLQNILLYMFLLEYHVFEYKLRSYVCLTIHMNNGTQSQTNQSIFAKNTQYTLLFSFRTNAL